MSLSSGHFSNNSSFNSDNSTSSSSNSNGNYNSILSHLLPSSMKNGLAQQYNQMNQQFTNFGVENKSGMSVVNLKDLIENYAYKFFKENEKEYHRKIGKAMGWKELGKEIDWRNLRLKHEPVRYQDVDAPGQPKSHVLFRSTFVNDTNKEQDYQLSAERKTTSSCSFELFEGYVTEGSAELSVEIPVPGCVLSAGAGFKREYSLENTRSKSISEEMTWSVSSNIRIPAMSRTTAELLVQENEYKGQFEIKTYFSGEVRVKLFKDGIELLAIELGDLDDIFTRERGFMKDNKGLFRVTRGECRARFGIEQKVELHQRPFKE